jgi:hypothetical protein
MKTRTWILLGAGLAAAIAFSNLAGRRGHKHAPVEVAEVEEAAPVPGPSRMHPSAPEPKYEDLVAADPKRNENREHRDAPVIDGVVHIGPPQIWAGAVEPPPPPPATAQTNTAWALSYAAAMCECHTRACAAELQGRFIKEMGAAEFDESRDGQASREAMQKAVSCYTALPADT